MATYTGGFATGDVLTAAIMSALGGAWNSYTPTLTQSGAVSKTVTYAKYLQFGKLFVAAFELTVTGSGTSGQPIYIGLPITGAAGVTAVGTAWLFDSSAGVHYVGGFQRSSTTAAGIIVNGYGSFVGASPSLALASGDNLRGVMLGEVA